MEWRWPSRGVRRAFEKLCRSGLIPAALCALALAGCNTLSTPQPSAAVPRGATVAFESIDGLPPQQFQRLVQDLNEEAQARRLAVAPRGETSAYRVRGYLAAAVVKRRTTIFYVWDVFDRNRQRALRISGAEILKGRHRNAWQLLDDAMLHRIADNSMSELAAFLVSPHVAPVTPSPAQVTYAAPDHASSREAAGIFRIFHPLAKPVSAADGSPSASTGASVPLPRRRPPPPTVVAARGAITLAAASRR